MKEKKRQEKWPAHLHSRGRAEWRATWEEHCVYIWWAHQSVPLGFLFFLWDASQKWDGKEGCGRNEER